MSSYVRDGCDLTCSDEPTGIISCISSTYGCGMGVWMGCDKDMGWEGGRDWDDFSWGL